MFRRLMTSSALRVKNTKFSMTASFSTNNKPTTGTRGPVTFASLAVTGLVGGALLVYYNIEKEEKIKQVSNNVVSVGKPSLGGPWVLVDQDGVTKTDASFRGKFTLLYFGFTYCPDICPSELVKVGKIMNHLSK